MPIPVTCSCGEKKVFDDKLAGRRIRCPACQEPMQIPNKKADEEMPPLQAIVRPKLPKEKTVVGKTQKALVMGIAGGGGLFAFLLVYFFVFANSASDPEKKGNPQSSSRYQGSLDQASYQAISGWAWDKEQPNAPVQVEIYDGDRLVSTVKADEFREDLVKEGIGKGKHAFGLRNPSIVESGKSHSIWAKISGTDIKLGEEPLPLTGDPPPPHQGSLEQASLKTISGWAWDRNQPNISVGVDIYDGEVLLGTVKADLLRDDLAKEGIGDGKHAFQFDTPASLNDGKSHSIRATISGTKFKLGETTIPASGK
jgi:hypothetical protein